LTFVRLTSQVPANLGSQLGQLLCNTLHVLVTTSRYTDDNVLVLVHRLGQLNGTKNGVRSLQRRDDTLELRHETEADEGLSISASNELGTVAVLPAGKLWSYTGVVETSRDRVSLANLSVLVLDNVGTDTVKDTLGSSRKSRAVTVCVDTVTTSLDTEELDGEILGEGVEHARGIAATTNAGNYSIGKLATLGLHLLLGLVSDNRLESTDDRGEGVGADGRSDDVVSCVEVNDPSAHGLVDCVTQGLSSSLNSNNLRTKQLDAEDVQGLTPDILGSHVDGALHVELGADSGCRNTVLTSSGLGNNLSFAQSPGNEYLSESVVDLVTSGMVQILSLQPDIGTSGVFSEALGKMQMSWSAHPVVVGTVLFPELGIFNRCVETLFKLRETIHERLRYVLTTKLAESWGKLVLLVESILLVCTICAVRLVSVEHLQLIGEARAVWCVGIRDDLVDVHTSGLFGLVQSLDYANLTSSLAGALSANLIAVLLNCFCALSWCSLDQCVDDLGTDNDTLSDLAYAQVMIACADTETDGCRNVAGVFVDALEELRESRVHCSAGTGDAHARYNVDEGIGDFAEYAHTVLGGSGCDEGDVGETAL
jgi:hypothetical protein